MGAEDFIQLPSDSVGKRTRTLSSVIGTSKNGNVEVHTGVVTQVDSTGSEVNPAVSEKVSTDNSSTTAIDDGDNFTGEWEDTNGYSSVKVAVKTDQDGYYEIQWSPDGVNADSTLTRYYRTAQIEPPHKFENMRQYVRVRFFNNSGTNQSLFRLQTILSSSAGMLNIPLDGTMSQDYDAISVRPSDLHYEVALGRRQGWTTWNKFGYNTDIDTGTDPEVIASFGGNSFTPPTTASVLSVSSSSANDESDVAGTGARTIRIIGVDANRDTQTEDVSLRGTSVVSTTNTWLGVNRAVVLTSGSNDANAGSILGTIGGSNQMMIPASESVTQQLIYFNPRNHQALVDWLILSGHRFGSGTEPVITFKGWVYSPLTGTKYEILRETLDESVSTELQLQPTQPFVLTEQDVFWIEAETTRDDTSVYGRFSLIAVRDADA